MLFKRLDNIIFNALILLSSSCLNQLISKEKPAKKASQKSADGMSTKTAPTGDVNANASAQPDTQSAKSSPASPTGAVYLGLRHTGLTTYVGLQPSDNYNW